MVFTAWRVECISLFRTMGYRHLIAVDGELQVTGMITRANMNEHNLHHYWEEHVSFLTCLYLTGYKEWFDD